ncbi:hypothetical protein CYMTET_29187, partial [Cymbomonas tetramitiformis]
AERLVPLPVDEGQALAAVKETLQSAALYEALLSVLNVTVNSAKVEAGVLVGPPHPPYPPAVPPPPPPILLQVTLVIDLQAPEAPTSSPPGTVESLVRSLVEREANAARCNNSECAQEAVSIVQLDASFYVTATMEVAEVSLWGASESATMKQSISAVCSTDQAQVTVESAHALSSNAGRAMSGRRHLFQSSLAPSAPPGGGSSTWLVTVVVEVEDARDARSTATVLHQGIQRGDLLRELRRGLQSVERADMAAPDYKPHSLASVALVLAFATAPTTTANADGAVVADVLQAALRGATPWLHSVVVEPWDAPRNPPTSLVETAMMPSPGAVAESDMSGSDGAGNAASLVIGISVAAGALAIIGGLGLLMRRQHHNATLKLSKSDKLARRLMQKRWGEGEAMAAAEMFCALDERSPGEWTPLAVLSPLKSAAGGVKVCVVSAESRLLRRTAIKVVRVAGGSKLSQVQEAALMRESAAMRRVYDTRVCRCHGVGLSTSRDVGWVIMELAEGETVEAMLSASRSGVIEQERAIRIGINVLRGLEALHATRLVHRDIKPANVVVSGDNDVKIIDLGICCVDTSALPSEVAASLGSRDATIMMARTELGNKHAGTPHYMALEQWESTDGLVDCRADIYAFGVMLFRMVTGRLPCAPEGFEATAVLQELGEPGELPDARAVAKTHVTDRLALTIAATVVKDAEKRTQTATQARLALQRCLLLHDADGFHVFISYRVRTESWFVEQLYVELRKRRVGGGKGAHCQVFWDKMCLQNGQPWEEGFMIGLTNSSMMVPIVSLGSTQPLTTATGSVDNVLLEWLTALGLAEGHTDARCALRGMFPVFLGKSIPAPTSGSSNAPTADAGHWCSNFFEDGSDGGGTAYPDVASAPTVAKFAQHIGDLGGLKGPNGTFSKQRRRRAAYGGGGDSAADINIRGVIWAQETSVEEMMDTIKSMEGFQAHQHCGKQLVEQCADAIVQAVDKVLAKKSSLEVGKVRELSTKGLGLLVGGTVTALDLAVLVGLACLNEAEGGAEDVAQDLCRQVGVVRERQEGVFGRSIGRGWEIKGRTEEDL